MNQKNCSLKVLHQNSAGKTRTCCECGNLHLEIGNLLAIVSEESLGMIIEEFKMKKNYIRMNSIETIGSKKIILELAGNNLFLSLNWNDFLETLELLEISQYYLQVHKILYA